jgi:hypothetical protein
MADKETLPAPADPQKFMDLIKEKLAGDPDSLEVYLTEGKKKLMIRIWWEK